MKSAISGFGAPEHRTTYARGTFPERSSGTPVERARSYTGDFEIVECLYKTIM